MTLNALLPCCPKHVVQVPLILPGEKETSAPQAFSHCVVICKEWRSINEHMKSDREASMD